ncbi:MAG: putative outer membrane protein [Bacteroidetes bacterium]|nr:putative outer membrane protein [Bacteroidota bacterium]
MRKLTLISVVLLIVSIPTFAGGLLTNTNQHILFLRYLARDASTQIDAVYSNPAGLAFMEDGFHMSFNVQSAFQTRTITSTFAPFEGNGGEATKKFKGEASVPFIPSLYGVYKKGNWAFSGSFAVTGGGGKATFNNGLGSFESGVAMVPATLTAAGLTGTDQYSVQSYMDGSQIIYGLQIGATYKINENFSAYVGMRANYVNNSYFGYLRDIQANINGGSMVNVSDYFTGVSTYLTQVAASYEAAGNTATAEAYRTQAATMQETAAKFEDKELDCDQTGWGITPILGVNFKKGKWNVGVKYEFNTKLNIENKTKKNTTGLVAYNDGVNTPHDIPSLLTAGVTYEILPELRASVGYHHFFDTHAKMANNKQDYINEGTNEFLAGAEWDVCKWAQVSAGMQRTKYDVGDGYQNDMSFAVSSYSYGFGAGFNIAKNAKVNVAYFWTNYGNYKEDYDSYNGTGLAGTDVYRRTNKVFGVGIDYKF